LLAGDPKLLKEEEGARCVKGCYRCLLSYYNQPDHEEIDRTDDAAVRLLLRLARSQAAVKETTANGAQSDWHAALARWGLSPDAEPLTVNGSILPMALRSHLVAAAIGEVDEEIRAGAESLGFVVSVLPKAPGQTPPAELVDLLRPTT
jgi:hypothetical protein